MSFLKYINIVKKGQLWVVLLFTISSSFTQAQIPATDSLKKQKKGDTASPGSIAKPAENKDLRKYKAVYDSSFSPRKATIRSAIFPGLGQIYNHQYWKLPLVYGAVGTTGGIFFYNLKTYKELRSAYILKADSNLLNDDQIPRKYRILSANSLKFYRDDFRRNVDLSVLAFIIAWGLNVVDATVSAHLKQFDVSDDLSLKLKPVLTGDGRMGVGLVINFK